MNPSPQDAAPPGSLRVEGPWLREATGRKWPVRGVTYGPFKPGSHGRPEPDEPRMHADLAHIAALGFNCIRVYEPPSDALLAACETHGLRMLCGIPWTQHVDFLSEKEASVDARARITQEARRLSRHSSVLGILVGNEIEKTLVRWMGPARVLDFIESLIEEARRAAPGKLVSYASYPSTEYLVPRNSDFIAFNVFLEDRDAFARYVQHLQNLAAGRPLLITEFGLDSNSHGEAAQADAFRWCGDVCAAQGVAGSFWFSYTDDWHRGGEQVAGWEFGLVRQDRTEKLAARSEEVAQSAPSPRSLPISVVVCSRNGSATLRSCLEALGRQSLAPHEIMVIDDGSTDATPEIARSFPFVRYARQDPAGLSAARNRGMDLATGDLIAYTDDDCIPDEDWLLHVAGAFEDERCVAAGGPNLPPQPRNATEACVAAAPGAPSHVLLDDCIAEHLPGCNLVIRRSALRAIGGFRDEFVCAGDDVDVCWRLQAHGGHLKFVPAAVVWHHRRNTIRAYLRQQRGYGRAEALLLRRYPHRFAWLGGARWRGMIYGDTPPHLLHAGAVIRFGRFGNALFQTVYTPNTPSVWDWMTGLPWLTVALLMLPLSAVWSTAWLVGVAMLLLMSAAAWRRTRLLPEACIFAAQAPKPLLWLLCLLQPVVRDWGRVSGMVRLRAWPKGRIVWPWKRRQLPPLSRQPHWWSDEVFWNEHGIGREQLLHSMRAVASKRGFVWDDGDEESACDAILLHRASGVLLGVATVTEFHEQGKMLTRAALGPRYRWWLQPLPAALLAGAVAWGMWHGPSWIAVLLIFGSLLLSLRSIRALHAANDLLVAAAERCGLRGDDIPREAGPEELHQRVLASTARSAELWADKP